MILVLFLIVLAVGALVTFAYYTDQELVTNSISNILDYKPDIECNSAGDCVEFFLPIPPENPDTIQEQHITIPVGYTINNVTNVMYDEKGNIVPESSYITGNVNDVSYSRQGIMQSKYNAVGDIMRVQIGNIATIEGNVKILDPDTKELIEPRTAKYTLTIDCSELTEFCNLSPIVKRGITSTAGTFIEKWTTSTRDTEGLYDVTIFARSETKDIFDRYYEVTNTLHLELFK